MNKLFHLLQNGRSFAFVARTGTTAILLSAVQHFEINSGVLMTSHDHLPPDCCVVVREPVARFRSNLWAMQTSADDAIKRLEVAEGYEHGKRSWRQHFRPVSTIVQSDSRVFRFLDPEIWAALGLPPYGEIASTSPHHPDLTTEQEEKVRNIYAHDIALWESLT